MADLKETVNPELYQEIQKVYDSHFVVKIPYTCKFDYTKGEEYIETHADHITIK